MRAFILTMSPRRAGLFADGLLEKDVRKTLDRATPPYKCYVYCIINRQCNETERRRALRDTKFRLEKWRGKIIGEFVCTEEKPFPKMPSFRNFAETQLSADEYNALRKDWYKIRTLTISDPIIYKKPLETTRFTLTNGKPVTQIYSKITEVKEIETNDKSSG